MPPILSWLLSGSAAVMQPQPAGPSAPAPAVTATVEFRAARIEIVGFDEAAVLAALRLRLSQISVQHHSDPLPPEAPHVYVEITRGPDETGRLRVITSDGRAYERSFAIEVGQEVRISASTTANLLFSIEQGAVAPDREDVAIPKVPADPPSEPMPAPDPVQASEPVKQPDVPPPPPKQPRAAWELGVGLHGATILGPGPPQYGGAFAGAGGGLGLELRGPRGAALALEARGIGRTDTGIGVGRLRIALAGGYAWRRGQFELPVLLALAIEPWWTTQSGQRASIYRGADVTLRHPLIGGYLRVTPALRLSVTRGRLAAVRVGPRVEAGGGFVLDDGAKVVGLADTSGEPHIRLGGFELSLGIEVALQFGLRRG